MSVLSDEQLMDIARPACGNFRWPSTALDIMRAAIAADRAARAEPMGEVIETWSCVNGHEQGTERIVQWADERNPPPVGAKVYTAPPAAPVVPGTITPKDAPDLCDDEDMRNAYADGWNNCRHAMFATVPALSQDNGGTA